MSKVYLCSFADTRLCLSALRFYQQAKAMQVFDYIFLYNETNLDKEFRDAMSNQACINGGGGNQRLWLLVLETTDYLTNSTTNE
ncbi:MAG: hypothetical protein SPJ83_05410 [Helicobacter sp.]|uniref:hypothetical protein n=1 Tax=Helicobacter sp. TaxID=218 RepID=UPI002A91FB80|nr:hypothetical protein [Helicobacter sp.]MDY5822222.1 hypothetical protein [Helicobacter sp.]